MVVFAAMMDLEATYVFVLRHGVVQTVLKWLQLRVPLILAWMEEPAQSMRLLYSLLFCILWKLAVSTSNCINSQYSAVKVVPSSYCTMLHINTSIFFVGGHYHTGITWSAHWIFLMYVQASMNLSGFNCTCPVGYEGTMCERVVNPNPCFPSPCENGGTCTVSYYKKTWCPSLSCKNSWPLSLTDLCPARCHLLSFI